MTTTGTVLCNECHDEETEQREPFRRTYLGRDRWGWTCSWCDRQAAIDARGEDDER